jgi:lysophospholipase L1-like esterase
VVTGGLTAFKLAVIGSSTAAGEGASRAQNAWVSLLETELEAAVTTSFSLENLAVGGYTARELLPGSGAKGSIDDAIAVRPDLIVIGLAGSNDLGPDTTTALFIAELTTLRDTARAAGIPVFFVSTQPKNFSTPDREMLQLWNSRMQESFGACWISDTSALYTPCYIGIFDVLADSSLGLAAAWDSGDGQHPNDAGHARIFEVAKAIVEPYVCAKTSCR